jgi:uncharacterized protein (DUF1800 family)
MKQSISSLATFVCTLAALSTVAGDTPPPVLQGVTRSNNVKTVRFTPAPAVDGYTLRSSPTVTGPFSNAVASLSGGGTFQVSNGLPAEFFKVGATPMSSNDLLSVNLLNRIAYGQTPDELTRVRTIGPQAYIAEQLAPEALVNTFDSYVVQVTNSVSSPPQPGWRFMTYTGFFSSSNLYMYLTKPGSAYIDDITLVPLTNYFVTNYTTNVNAGVTNITTNTTTLYEASTNILVNGDFETGGTAPWIVSANMINSVVTNDQAHSGSYALKMVATVGGTTRGDSIVQDWTNLWFRFENSSTRGVLSFWYLESPTTRDIKLRLSGNGLVGSGNNQPPAPGWIYATATGRADTNRNTIYIYLDGGAGEAYVDDLKLVPGSVPEVGNNCIRNGDFETPLGVTNWNLTANFTNSFISTNYARSGEGSLKVVGTADGGGSGNSIFQTNIFITNGQTYTVSFWYLPPTRGRTLTVRFSGADPGDDILQIYEPGSTPGSVRRLLDNLGAPSFVDGSVNVSAVGGAFLHDLRSYHVSSAINSKRQLVEVLLQFLENHFVTQHSKSVDYFDRFYDDFNLIDKLASDWEYRERVRWQAALLNPNCTFYDLLKIHVESPAEIVYLDSVDSRGNSGNIANENYAREIMELFCMGVDNGYDQYDITVMSRAWTGWSVEIVEPENIYNPFAPQTQRVGFYPNNGTGGTSNLIGVWTFNYKSANHGTNRAPIWSEWDTNSPATSPRPIGSSTYPHTAGQSKIVPARFGLPWAGQPYRLVIPASRSGTNGVLDGYDITAHIANLPFTMEYLSVKLCRLFVHDEFPNPTTRTNLPEYAFYDYTNPNRSAEAELVRQCMVAWDTPGPDGRKGNIRNILNTIFNSDLFRSHGGSLQKVKTPLEFAVSAIRALQSTGPSGTLTAASDGYSISGRSRTASSSPLTRMGTMMLFDRDAPDGFPEAGAPWISAGTLAERTRFIQTYLMAVNDGSKADGISGGNNNLSDPVALLKAKVPAGSWGDAGAVSDFFLGILFPGEGAGNLASYRQLCIDFLNTSDDGLASSLFSGIGNTTTAYDNRVRALVAALMSSPRFQEQ